MAVNVLWMYRIRTGPYISVRLLCASSWTCVDVSVECSFKIYATNEPSVFRCCIDTPIYIVLYPREEQFFLWHCLFHATNARCPKSWRVQYDEFPLQIAIVEACGKGEGYWSPMETMWRAATTSNWVILVKKWWRARPILRLKLRDVEADGTLRELKWAGDEDESGYEYVCAHPSMVSCRLHPLLSDERLAHLPVSPTQYEFNI